MTGVQPRARLPAASSKKKEKANVMAVDVFLDIKEGQGRVEGQKPRPTNRRAFLALAEAEQGLTGPLKAWLAHLPEFDPEGWALPLFRDSTRDAAI